MKNHMKYFSEPYLNQISSFFNLNLERKGERKVVWLERLHCNDLKILLWCRSILGCTKSLQSCPALGDPVECSPPGSSIHRILQARILAWVAKPSCRRSSQPRDQTQVSMSPALAADSLPLAPPGKTYSYVIKHLHRISATHHSYCGLTSLWYYPKLFSFNLFIHNPNSREFMCTHSYIHTDILFPKSCLSLLALWCICLSLWSSRSL